MTEDVEDPETILMGGLTGNGQQVDWDLIRIPLQVLLKRGCCLICLLVVVFILTTIILCLVFFLRGLRGCY